MKKLFLSLILITVLQQAKSQWNGNSATNNQIVAASGTATRTDLVSVSDGSGNIYIAWVDARNAATGDDIYIQKINNDGTLPWAAEKVVCNAANSQSSIYMISDGSGGVILAWTDKRSGTTSNDDEVYGQRINSDGSAGWATNGVLLTKASPSSSIYRRNPVLEKVSATEFMVVFTQLGTLGDLYIQKNLISDGSPVWASDVDLHGAQANNQTTPQILNDGTGGAYIIWGDPRLATSNTDIYGQKIANNGSKVWESTGRLLCSAANNQLNPVMVTDKAGGFVAAWSDLRNGSSNGDIFIQRFNDSGAGQWGSTAVVSQGMSICSSANSSLYLKMINSLTDYILVWTDQRTSGTTSVDLFAQKINSNGVIQWNNTPTTEGVAIVTATGSQGNGNTEFTLNDNGSGTCWLTWSDPRLGSTDNNIFAQKLNSDGTIAFATDGVFVSSATLNQKSPTAVSDGNGGLIVAWQDSRSGTTNAEIYASRLFSNGTLPVTFTQITASLNTNQKGLVKWHVASEVNTEKYIIEKAGSNGQFYALETIPASKSSTYSVIDPMPFLGDNYYRVKAVDFDGTLSYSSVATLKVSSLNAASISIYPNPAAKYLSVDLRGFEQISGGIKIQIYDLKGSLQMKESFEVDTKLIELNIEKLNSGTYILKLQDNTGKQLKVQNFIKD